VSCVCYLDGQTNCLTAQKKVHRDVTLMQLSTCVANSSRYIEHIINLLQHQVKLISAVKTEVSMEPISRSRCMKSGLTKAFDQCLPIGR
jgi:hypothetical protein